MTLFALSVCVEKALTIAILFQLISGINLFARNELLKVFEEQLYKIARKVW